MKSNHRRIPRTIVLGLVLLLVQVYLSLGLAAPNAVAPRVSPQQVNAILTTQANKPISVNGVSTMSGATILTGATIETRGGVSAAVDIPGHGTLMIPANTKLVLNFDQSGNMAVTLVQGCAVLNTKKGTRGEMDNSGGAIGRSDGSNEATIDTCQTPKSPAKAGGGGLSTGAGLGIGAAGFAGEIALALRGSNPSPARP
jgi:hypothetical protein